MATWTFEVVLSKLHERECTEDTRVDRSEPAQLGVNATGKPLFETPLRLQTNKLNGPVRMAASDQIPSFDSKYLLGIDGVQGSSRPHNRRALEKPSTDTVCSPVYEAVEQPKTISDLLK